MSTNDCVSKLASTEMMGKLAAQYGLSSEEATKTLLRTLFADVLEKLTYEQALSCLMLATKYDLDIFSGHIKAGFDVKRNRFILIVSWDGWISTVNRHQAYDGMEYRFSDALITLQGSKVPVPEWTECLMFRKDRSHPIVIREYAVENYVVPAPGFEDESVWATKPNRCMCAVAFKQCARITFGLEEFYDVEEAKRLAQPVEGLVQTKTVEPIVVEVQPVVPTEAPIIAESAAVVQLRPVASEKPVESQPVMEPEPIVSLLLDSELEQLNAFALKLFKRAETNKAWAACRDYLQSSELSPQHLRYTLDRFNTLVAEAETMVVTAKTLDVDELSEPSVHLNNSGLDSPAVKPAYNSNF